MDDLALAKPALRGAPHRARRRQPSSRATGRRSTSGGRRPKNKKIGQRLARFRQINMDNAVAHHDALEFPDGQVVLLTRLCVGQRATVLQLPAAARPEPRENQATPEVCEPALSS
jgi:hypothetical protein